MKRIKKIIALYYKKNSSKVLAIALLFSLGLTSAILISKRDASNNSKAQTTVINTHVFKFYFDPALVPDMALAKQLLPKYVADMNTILAKNTNRRFSFNPDTGIIITSTKPYTGSGGVLPTTGFEVWAHAVPVASTSAISCCGGMSYDQSGAAVLGNLQWTKIYDRDTLVANTPEMRDYWTQVDHMLHEFGHVFGAAFGEYYNLGTIKDTTGVLPTLNISLADPADSFWSDKPDFKTDPMLRISYGATDLGNPVSHADLLNVVKYSNLTAADMNGAYRPPTVNPPTIDLQHINIKVVDKNQTPLPGANVKVWSVVGVPPTYTTKLLADTLTDSTGTLVIPWGGGPDPHNNFDFLRLVKVYKDGFSAAKYISIYDADISKLVNGQNIYTATIALGAVAAPTSIPTPTSTPTPTPTPTPSPTPTPTSNTITEDWTGINGSVWPSKWIFEGATAGIKTKDIQNNQGRIVEKSGAAGRVIAFSNSATAMNTNQTVQFKISSNDATFGLMSRRSDADSDTYYYAVAVAGAPNNLKIKKVVDGVATNIAYISRPIVANTDYKIRFEVGADTNPAKTLLKVKVWEANKPEPSTYNLSKADAEPRLQGKTGRFGLVYGLANVRQVFTDYYLATILP